MNRDYLLDDEEPRSLATVFFSVFREVFGIEFYDTPQLAAGSVNAALTRPSIPTR